MRIVVATVQIIKMRAWIDAAVEQHLPSEPVITIGGLVVREDMRGHRVGQKQCCAVEAWAAQIGLSSVRVRSHQKGTDAHRFYARYGYKQVKTSKVFGKRVLLTVEQSPIQLTPLGSHSVASRH